MTTDGDGLHFDPDLVTQEFGQLYKFYDVENLQDLVRVQAKHIQRLQQLQQLPTTPDDFPPTPRIG